MSEELVPSYSDTGLSARDIFFTSGYKIHFFVEDITKENLYETIFCRIFKKIGEFKILPLGGKSAVLAHAASATDIVGIRRVYVLDKDFDDLHQITVDDPRIFYLDDYCIEGTLLDETSLVQFAMDESPAFKKSEIVSRLSFDDTLGSWLPKLDRLHRAFFLVQKHSIGIKNCDCSVFEFCNDMQPWLIDDVKVSIYIKGVEAALVEARALSSAKDYSEAERAAFMTGRVLRKHINGKYLQDLFIAFLRHKSLVRGSIRTESVTIRLARSSRLTRLSNFRRKVSCYISTQAA